MKRERAIPVLLLFGLALAGGRRRRRVPTAPPEVGPEPPSPTAPPEDLEPWEQATVEVEAPGDEVIELPPEGTVIADGHPHTLCPIAKPLAGADEASYCVVDPFGDVRFAPREKYAPLAPVNPIARWPLQTANQRRLVTSYWSQDGTLRGSWGRQFGSSRAGKDRKVWHAGVDLFSSPGDIVVAPENATVLTILPFHHGSWAVYLLTEDRRVINLGEVVKLSWREFGVKPGQQVHRGQPLARTGVMEGGSTMLHVEIYDAMNRTPEEMVAGIRKGRLQWPDKENPPPELMDPSAYLLQAAVSTYRQELAGA